MTGFDSPLYGGESSRELVTGGAAVVVLGVAPSLAVTTTLANALALGVLIVLVFVLSRVLGSLVNGIIPEYARETAFLFVVALCVTTVDLLAKSLAPSFSRSLGIYLPLIAVNSLLLGRFDASVGPGGAGPSAFRAFVLGLRIALALCAIAAVRELLGTGGITLPGVFSISLFTNAPIGLFQMSAGALILAGLLQAVVNRFTARKPRTRM